MNQLNFISIFILLFTGVIFICEILYKKFNVSSENTRKLAHIISGLFSLSFIFIFDAVWSVLILGIIFFLVLFLGRKYYAFKSIDSHSRVTYGSFLLPVSISILFVVSKSLNNDILYILPLLILGLSDPIAGIVGLKVRKGNSKIKVLNKLFDKTYFGSLTFFISSFLISILAFKFCNHNSGIIIHSLILAIITTLVEAISTKGYDNITIPISALIYLTIIM